MSKNEEKKNIKNELTYEEKKERKIFILKGMGIVFLIGIFMVSVSLILTFTGVIPFYSNSEKESDNQQKQIFLNYEG